MKAELKFIVRRHAYRSSNDGYNRGMILDRLRYGKEVEMDFWDVHPKTDKAMCYRWGNRGGANSHSFSRWLHAQVGRNWDHIYSDASHTFQGMKTDLDMWVKWRVCQNVVLMDDGKLWEMDNYPHRLHPGELYVDEERILRSIPHQPKVKREKSAYVYRSIPEWKQKEIEKRQKVAAAFLAGKGTPHEPLGYCKKHFILKEFFLKMAEKNDDWVRVPYTSVSWKLNLSWIVRSLKNVRRWGYWNKKK